MLVSILPEYFSSIIIKNEYRQNMDRSRVENQNRISTKNTMTCDFMRVGVYVCRFYTIPSQHFMLHTGYGLWDVGSSSNADAIDIINNIYHIVCI